LIDILVMPPQAYLARGSLFPDVGETRSGFLTRYTVLSPAAMRIGNHEKKEKKGRVPALPCGNAGYSPGL
jgi:hypothetical protein